MNKECVACAEVKSAEEFYKNKANTDGLYSYCKECTTQQQSLYQYKRRKKIIDQYGGKCLCCGEETFEFLAIDHIFNNGVPDRKKRGGTFGLVAHMEKTNSPEYQILCHNCNMARAYYGRCPHELK